MKPVHGVKAEWTEREILLSFLVHCLCPLIAAFCVSVIKVSLEAHGCFSWWIHDSSKLGIFRFKVNVREERAGMKHWKSSSWLIAYCLLRNKLLFTFCEKLNFLTVRVHFLGGFPLFMSNNSGYFSIFHALISISNSPMLFYSLKGTCITLLSSLY